MGKLIDLFVTYRFLKLLTTLTSIKTDAYKLGIIDKDGHRILKKEFYIKTTGRTCNNTTKKCIHNFTQTSLQYQKIIQQSARS